MRNDFGNIVQSSVVKAGMFQPMTNGMRSGLVASALAVASVLAGLSGNIPGISAMQNRHHDVTSAMAASISNTNNLKAKSVVSVRPIVGRGVVNSFTRGGPRPA